MFQLFPSQVRISEPGSKAGTSFPRKPPLLWPPPAGAAVVVAGGEAGVAASGTCASARLPRPRRPQRESRGAVFIRELGLLYIQSQQYATITYLHLEIEPLPSLDVHAVEILRHQHRQH